MADEVVGAAGEVVDTAEEVAASARSVVARALLEISKDVGGWGVGDLTLGVYCLAKHHARERKANPPQPAGEVCRDAWVCVLALAFQSPV